jgi:hypothetical protein
MRSPPPMPMLGVRWARLRVMLAVTVQRLRDRWHERRSGRRRRWDRVPPPPGQSGEYVLLRDATEPVLLRVGGPEFEPDGAPPPPGVAWKASRYWRPRGDR